MNKISSQCSRFSHFIVDQYKLSKKEIIILFKWSTPLIISNLLNNVSFLFVNLIFVGRQNEVQNELSAAALANTWTYCTLSLGTGLANAMDTLVSQSFGANNLQLVGLVLQRASIVNCVAFLIVTVLWCITEYFLLLVGQDKDVSHMAFQYSLYLLPGLWFQLQTNIFQKYLQCQGIMWPSIAVGVILNGFNVLFNVLLVNGLGSYGGMGYRGAALATSISRVIAFISMISIFAIWKLHKETWFGLKREALKVQGFKEYLKLAIPASIQHASEAVGFEVLTILAGLISTTDLDAHSVTYNFTMLTYQFPSGISIAVSVRVGQLLGSKNEAMAKRISWIAFLIAIVFMAIVAIIQYSCRHGIGYIYTNDKDVVEIVASILPIAAIFQVFDGGQTIFQGVVRGMGRVITGSVCNFIAFYVIAIPLAVIFAFPVDVGVKGLWWGLCVGLVVICIVLCVIVNRVDWSSEVDRAAERTKSGVFKKEDIEGAIKMETIKVSTTNSVDSTFTQHEEYNNNNKSSVEDDSEEDDIDDDYVDSSSSQTPQQKQKKKKKKRNNSTEFRQDNINYFNNNNNNINSNNNKDHHNNNHNNNNHHNNHHNNKNKNIRILTRVQSLFQNHHHNLDFKL
ncbi:hypothetical protein DICPUDRAFT_54031 [Dictyostelium purpureum]|uniref:Multidrug and toxin extrusion protein n=1 Tax=Dictyostelium purpureum TaxID=5786 RepID=F0ZFB3_DICPU|nr:uncharacterized protein DICPUDRAFT_54031 [Dictyostelium purpureum]EGC37376.1 hypothetical protein DICPUDRAFT_54031 [Dictyostelium purpureum]|eukprot:XP_003286117.1 hypothetical protein DICPUDRAFT_54031 [Dictyostelium purpureum]